MSSVLDYFKPTPRQMEAYKHIGKGGRIFYGGARGGGKTAFALWSAVMIALQFPGVKIVAVRETYPELEDVFIEELQKKYPDDVFGYEYKQRTKTATFGLNRPKNEQSKIIFRACDSPKAAKKIQGIEYQYMILDEAPQYDVRTIHKLSGSLRTSNANGFVPSFLMTGNPGGISDTYFITRYVNPQYDKWEKYELKHKDKYIFIPATVFDNEYVTKDYMEMLEGLPEGLRKAWLEGKWGTFEGQFFEDWSPAIHVIEPFSIPRNWIRKAGFDLGWTRKHPAVCVWVAQDPESRDLFVYREYTNAADTESYADDIMEMEANDGYVETWADPSMFGTQKKQQANAESDSQIFLRKGKFLQPANNKREPGWRIVKQWLHYTKETPPKLFVFNTCQKLIETIPTLKYDENGNGKKNDLDTRMQDDAVDALRYVLVSGFTYPTREEMKELEMSQQASRAIEQRRALMRSWGEDVDSETFIPEKADYS